MFGRRRGRAWWWTTQRIASTMRHRNGFSFLQGLLSASLLFEGGLVGRWGYRGDRGPLHVFHVNVGALQHCTSLAGGHEDIVRVVHWEPLVGGLVHRVDRGVC